MANMSAFQANDESSILSARTKNLWKTSEVASFVIIANRYAPVAQLDRAEDF